MAQTVSSFRLTLRHAKHDDVTLDVPAKIVGDLAVHKLVTWYDHQAAPGFGREYAITHIPTGMLIKNVYPRRWFDRGAVVAKQREMVAFAKAFQEACPAFFDAARPGVVADISTDIFHAALAAARAIEAAMDAPSGEAPRTTAA